jgi:hypothetical protein
VSTLTRAVSVQAYNGPIEIYNICLNPADSVATLSFTNLKNPCGTFSEIIVKGRVVKTNPDPYSVLYSSAVLPGNSISIKQADLKQRSFFIEFLYACNGVDTLRSDTVNIDLSPPIDLELDSVSVDIATQKVLIGWPKNSSPDYKGYLVYIRNGVNNQLIQDQNNEGYLHFGSNPTSRSIQYTYNTYDTCNNKSLLSKLHGTMHLTRKYNKCANEIDLNWSPYIGWETSSYDIYVSKNASAYTLLGATSNTNFSHQNLEKGSTYCYFIRSHKQSSNITSSSNSVCQVIPNNPVVNNTHIQSISVVNKNQISIQWFTQDALETKNAQIYRGTNKNNLSLINETTYNNGINTYTDMVNTEDQPYIYQIVVPDSCSQNNDSSLIHKSVYLTISQSELAWSSFKYDKSVAVEDIIYSNNGSTWNPISKTTTGENQGLSINADSAKCYRVATISTSGDTSYSNQICILSDLNIYVPTALKTNSNIGNNLFTIYGTGIDWEKSSVSVFDRWGGKILEINNNQRTWDAKDAISGTYIYAGYVYGVKGEQVLVKGKLTILK